MNRYSLIVGLALAGGGLLARAQEPDPVPPPFERSEKAAGDPDDHDIFDPDANAPKMIQVQLEYIELSHEALTKLLFLCSPKNADATDLRKQVQDMVSKDEAKILETQIVTAQSGQKSSSESIHEFIYPTEYEPPSLPCGGNDPSTVTTMKSHLAPIPTAFETRNLGSTLEIEPTVGGDNKTIDLRLVPEIVYHTGNTVWYDGKDGEGNPFKLMMPDMYSMRLNTALTCINNQYTLAATASPKDAKGEIDTTRKVMIFVKCDVLTVK